MTNTKFITNQDNNTLKKRLNKLLQNDTKDFAVLVGYFYISGFFQIADMLENVKEIRILIGLATDKHTAELFEESHQTSFDAIIQSSLQKQEALQSRIVDEISKADDREEIEKGIEKFINWVKSDKLKVRYYEKSQLHAKMYVMSFDENDRNTGHVITGSSNLSKSGLQDNLELNVELRDDDDHNFALKKFNELWSDSVDVTSMVVETINKKTHLNTEITPYDVYMKFLYEYFRRDLELEDGLADEYLPDNYINLKYQRQAVLTAQKILDEYNGVFIADVVGLGKTYISARLASQLPGRKLVLASPKLIDKSNPGSWSNAFRDFGVRGAEFESIGSLHKIKDPSIYNYVFIDESHAFRNEVTQSYAKLHEICYGKKVILVSATPYNNRVSDIEAQIGLFQDLEASTIPGVKNLKSFFRSLEKPLKELDRKNDREEYKDAVRASSERLREEVLRHVMVRRTRREIEKWYGKDLAEQNMSFPSVEDPRPIYYELDADEDRIFYETIDLLKQFSYTFYRPLTFLKSSTARDIQSQENSAGFIRAYMVKRFESSVFAFNSSIARFIQRHEKAISIYEDSGEVYITRKLADKVNRLLDEDNEDAILKLIDKEQVEKHTADEFEPEYVELLKSDLIILQKIQKTWGQLTRDPKLEAFIEKLSNEIQPSVKNKIIIFSESRETAEYLGKKINEIFPTIVYTGSSHARELDLVIDNFDARSINKSDDYHVLVATDVLSEGVNLHQSFTVINYDIPWNPTRMIQRVGRVDRVDTKHKHLLTYNVFPTEQGNNEIKLRESAESKIAAIIELLGNDAKLLTEDESIRSNELFKKIQDKRTITGEEEDERSELEYLEIIKNLRESNTTEFARIRDLPLKLRVARTSKPNYKGKLVAFLKKGEETSFVVTDGNNSGRIGFFETANILVANKQEKPHQLSNTFYKLLHIAKSFIKESDELIRDSQSINVNKGLTYAIKIQKRLRSIVGEEKLTLEQKESLASIREILSHGAIPKNYQKLAWQAIENDIDSLSVLTKLKHTIPRIYFSPRSNDGNQLLNKEKIVLLSEYFE